MAQASATITLPVAPDRVWQLIGGFDSLPDWLPSMTISNLRAGRGSMSLRVHDGKLEVLRNSTTFEVVHAAPSRDLPSLETRRGRRRPPKEPTPSVRADGTTGRPATAAGRTRGRTGPRR